MSGRDACRHVELAARELDIHDLCVGRRTVDPLEQAPIDMAPVHSQGSGFDQALQQQLGQALAGLRGDRMQDAPASEDVDHRTGRRFQTPQFVAELAAHQSAPRASAASPPVLTRSRTDEAGPEARLTRSRALRSWSTAVGSTTPPGLLQVLHAPNKSRARRYGEPDEPDVVSPLLLDALSPVSSRWSPTVGCHERVVVSAAARWRRMGAHHS